LLDSLLQEIFSYISRNAAKVRFLEVKLLSIVQLLT